MFHRSAAPPHGAPQPQRTVRREPTLDGLLHDAGANIREAVALLHRQLVDCPDGSIQLADELQRCEREGDRITHDVIHRLRELGPARSPVDVADGLRLATTIDDILDHAEQTAALVVLFAVEAAMEEAVELSEVLRAAGDQTADALDAFASGQPVAPFLTEIHRLENEGDRISRAALASLFVGGIDPMVVIRWKDLYDSLESAIDACEAVAIQLEGLLLAQG